jgi:hypothetical protein
MEMRGWEDEGDLELSTFEEERSSRGLLSKVIALASVTALVFGGYTLAANIGLGTGSALEFGQGVQVTSACDSNISLKPVATYLNDVPSPDHYVTGLDLSGISQKCQGKLFVIKAYGETGTFLPLGPVRFPVIKIQMNGSSWRNFDAGCNMLDSQNSSSQAGESNFFRITMDYCARWWTPSPGFYGVPLHSADTYRFTLETMENSMVRIDLTSNYGNGDNLGWALAAPEGTEVSMNTGGNTVPLFFDKKFENRFLVFIGISSADLANNSVGPSLVSLTTSPTVSCAYSGKSAANSPIPSGLYQGMNSPNRDSVRFECTTTGDGTVTAS